MNALTPNASRKGAACIENEILRRSAAQNDSHAFDRVYINGDSHVPNTAPIETVFVNAMR